MSGEYGSLGSAQLSKAQRLLRNPIRLPLVDVTRLADGELGLDIASRLLDHVGQLVGQGFAAAGAMGIILTPAEEDVLAGGESPGGQSLVERVGLGVGVDPNTAEVGAESRLHLGAYSALQGAPTSPGPSYLPLDFRRNLRCFLGLAGDIYDALNIAVAVAALQLEQSSTGAGGTTPAGGPVQGGGMGPRVAAAREGPSQRIARADRSSDTFARDFSLRLLRDLEPGALLLAEEDNVVFPLSYLHHVEGVRPDVELTMQGVNHLDEMRIEPATRPTYFTHPRDLRSDALALHPDGLAFRLLPAEVPFSRRAWPELAGGPQYEDDRLVANLAPDAIRTFAFTPDGRTLAAMTERKNLVLWRFGSTDAPRIIARPCPRASAWATTVRRMRGSAFP